MTQAPTVPGIFPRQPWQEHLRSLTWDQGDHILVAAPTKAGKTTLMSTLVRKRSHVVVFVTKLKDPTFETQFPRSAGWKVYREWPADARDIPAWDTRILLWPRQMKTLKATYAEQRRVFAHAIDAIAYEGNRCVVIDEGLMFTNPRILGFATEMELMHYYGRSSGISMVFLTQRPAWIPPVIYSSATHAYIAKTTHRDDMKKLADMGGIDHKLTAENIMRLNSRHDYTYLNPQGDAPPTIINTRK